MKNSKVLETILFISGLILAAFGAAILLMPVEMAALNGIDLDGQISLLSETRAPGGALLASGILVISGAFIPKLTFTSVVVSALVYLSYGLSRILGMAIDGMPARGLVQATVLEIVTGLVCVFALVKYREADGSLQ
jgi:hypothetical protein